MTHREFVSWRALFQVMPYDDEHCFQIPAGQVAVQINRLRGRNDQLAEFVPHHFRPVTEQPEAGELDSESSGLMSYLHTRSRLN